MIFLSQYEDLKDIFETILTTNNISSTSYPNNDSEAWLPY